MQLPVCHQSLAPPPGPASNGLRQTGQGPGRVSERGEQEQQAERGRETRDGEEEQQIRERLVLRKRKKLRQLGSKTGDSSGWKQDEGEREYNNLPTDFRTKRGKCKKLH